MKTLKRDGAWLLWRSEQDGDYGGLLAKLLAGMRHAACGLVRRAGRPTISI